MTHKHDSWPLLKDVVFIIHWSVRYTIERERDRRYKAGVAEIVAGDASKKIMAIWKAHGSPGTQPGAGRSRPRF